MVTQVMMSVICAEVATGEPRPTGDEVIWSQTKPQVLIKSVYPGLDHAAGQTRQQSDALVRVYGFRLVQVEFLILSRVSSTHFGSIQSELRILLLLI